MTWAIGDRGFYVLPKSLKGGRPQTLYLAFEVINVTAKRVVVRQLSGRRNHRVLAPWKLVRSAPEGAWIR